MTDASLLTLTAFVADMTRAFALCQQVQCPTLPVTVDVALTNPTANFAGRGQRSRLWLAQAIALCKRHGIALPRMRRVTADERQAFAVALSGRVWCATMRHGYDARTGQECVFAHLVALAHLRRRQR